MNISYDWYKVFCCVAECGNITLASEKLYISQPAVSQSIKQLEESVGCLLFTRTPKGVILTSEGKVLYSFASAGVDSFREGERQLLSMLRLDAGEIRIGASDMTLEYCLLPYLEAFHEKYPDVRISITNSPTPHTMDLLKEGKIDFAAVSEPVVCHDDCECTPVREIRDIFICGTGARLAEVKSVSDIPADQLILLEAKTSTRSYIESEFRKRGITSLPKFELATSQQIVSFTVRKLGIGCVVSDFANDAISRDTVREIKVIDPFPSRKICIMTKKSETSRAAETLINMIKDEKNAACGVK